MRNFLTSLFSFLLLLMFSTCNAPNLERTMVRFDQAFIPVYYYTYTGNLERAQTSMLVLDSRWGKLQTQFGQEATNAHNWRESFQMITAWLDEAECAIKNKEADLALIQLDHARYEMMDLRWREGNTYYLDKVWDLEAAINNIVQVSNDSMLDLLEWNEFMPMVYEVEDTWSKLLASTCDQTYFDFDTTDQAEEIRRKAALGFAVEDFLSAVVRADRCEVESAAQEMQAAYLNYMFLFGDFDATMTFYAAHYHNN